MKLTQCTDGLYKHSLLALGTLDSTSAVCFGAISNSKITNNKHKDAKQKQKQTN